MKNNIVNEGFPSLRKREVCHKAVYILTLEQGSTVKTWIWKGT